MKNKNEDMDRWFKILTDEQRAEIMKTQILEVEKTKRQAIDAESLYKRSENYSLIRVVFIIFLLLTVFCVTCVGHRYVDRSAPSSVPTNTP